MIQNENLTEDVEKKPEVDDLEMGGPSGDPNRKRGIFFVILFFS